METNKYIDECQVDHWGNTVRGIKNFLGSNENENTTSQNLWDTEKSVLIRKCIATCAYIKKRDL
jgi:hypothetical protein